MIDQGVEASEQFSDTVRKLTLAGS